MWRAKRFPAKPSTAADTSDQRIGAAIGRNSCRSSIRRAASAEQGGALRRRLTRHARHRAICRLPRRRSGAWPQRNWRRTRPAKSTERPRRQGGDRRARLFRRAAAGFRARPVARQPVEEDIGARTLGKLDRQGRAVEVAEQSVAVRDQVRAAFANRDRHPGRGYRVGQPFEPGFEDRAAADQPSDVERGDQRVAVDRLGEQAADVGVGDRAVVARRDEPEEAADRIEAKRVARQRDAPRIRKVGECPAEDQIETRRRRKHGSRRALWRRSTELPRAALRRRRAPLRGESGEAVRLDQACPKSRRGRCPGRCGQARIRAGRAAAAGMGRGARRRISSTRSVIATISSTAPSVSLSEFLLLPSELPPEHPGDLMRA